MNVWSLSSNWPREEDDLSLLENRLGNTTEIYLCIFGSYMAVLRPPNGCDGMVADEESHDQV